MIKTLRKPAICIAVTGIVLLALMATAFCAADKNELIARQEMCIRDRY